MCPLCNRMKPGEALEYISRDLGYAHGSCLAEHYRRMMEQPDMRPANRCRVFTCKRTVPEDGTCWYCAACYEKLHEAVLELWRRYHCRVLPGDVDLADDDAEAHRRFEAGHYSNERVYRYLSKVLGVEPTALMVTTSTENAP